MRFTIITIAFNSEKTIERTIKSVLAQTYKEYEYVVVDGASKDGTLDIVKRYEPLFEGRMKWKSEPDKGIYNAMNKGIKMASGDIIGIVNSDDWLDINALLNIEMCVEENGGLDNKIFCGWINFHYLDGTVQTMKTSQYMLEKLAKSYKMGGIRHPAVFVPRKVYEMYGMFDERMKVLADTDFILRLYFKGLQFCYPEKVISNMSDGGVSNKYQLKAYSDYKLLLQKYNLSSFTYRYYLYSWKLKRIIKSLIPTKLIYLYRNYSKA